MPPYMPPGTDGGDCRQWLYDCAHDTLTQILIGLESAVFMVYFGLFFFYLGRAYHQLRGRNYRHVPVSPTYLHFTFLHVAILWR